MPGILHVAAGHWEICADPACLVQTVVGPGLAIAVLDPQIGLLGLQHATAETRPPGRQGQLLPESALIEPGLHQMLLALSSSGARAERMRAMLLGGAGPSGGEDPSLIQAAESVLGELGISASVRDIAGGVSRRVMIRAGTGQVRIESLG